MLIALTLERASAAQAAAVRRRLGDPGLDRPGVDELRTIIEETGGLAACEAMIERYQREAEKILDSAPSTPSPGRTRGARGGRRHAQHVMTQSGQICRAD